MTDWVRRLTPQNGWHLRHQLLRMAGYLFVINLAASYWFVTHTGDPAVRAALPWAVPLYVIAMVVPLWVPAIRRGHVPGSAMECLGLRTVIVPRDPDLAELAIAADDPGWAERLFSDPEALAAVKALHGGATAREGRCIYVRPTVVELVRLPVDARSATDTIPAHVAALGRLAEAVERQSPPERLRTESAIHRAYRRMPGLWTVGWTVLGLLTAIAWALWPAASP